MLSKNAEDHMMILLMTTTILVTSTWDHISAVILTHQCCDTNSKTVIFDIGGEDEDNEK